MNVSYLTHFAEYSGERAESKQLVKDPATGKVTEMRKLVLKAQFEVFLENNKGIPTSVFSWSEKSVKFAFLTKHWLGSAQWSEMAKTGGVLALLAFLVAPAVAGEPDAGLTL